MRRPASGRATRRFGCFDVRSGLAPSAEKRFALSSFASPKQRVYKKTRSLPGHLRIPPFGRADPKRLADRDCIRCYALFETQYTFNNRVRRRFSGLPKASEASEGMRRWPGNERAVSSARCLGLAEPDGAKRTSGEGASPTRTSKHPKNRSSERTM